MIKATIQNSPYRAVIRFPCSETELSRKLEEIKMNPEDLAPMAMVIEIEPEELSMLTDCDVSLDALNYLGKRMDGMSKSEREQFLAVLSSNEIGIGCSLKNIINLTYNLARFTLIKDSDDLEYIGRTHILNVRGYISESESNNHEWLAEQGVKLLESGSGIETDYGKIYINKDVPFKEVFNGRTFPAYYCEINSVAEIAIEYNNLIELVELPCEDITIKKALCRLGADGLKDCKIADKMSGLTDEETEKFLHVKRLCENVANYCEAYENGEPIDIPDYSDGFRVIYSVGNAKMAARFSRASGFEFITWSDYEYPRFYESYDEAREKYAVLSGLVDAERVFSDEELQTLCYCVCAVSEMCDNMTDDMTKLLNDLGRKLDIAVSWNYTKNGGEKHGCKV